MLQAALLLFGCALSRYLWEIDVTVASVVLSVTSFGAIFYFFFVIVGTASEGCPYQTPAAHVCRHILRRLPASLRSASVAILGVSSNIPRISQPFWYYRLFSRWWLHLVPPWHSMGNVYHTLQVIISLPKALVHDVYLLERPIVRVLVTVRRTVKHRLIGGHRMAHRWFIDITSLRTLGLDHQMITLDLWCILWIL
jgi:hypothetical protein